MQSIMRQNDQRRDDTRASECDVEGIPKSIEDVFSVAVQNRKKNKNTKRGKEV